MRLKVVVRPIPGGCGEMETRVIDVVTGAALEQVRSVSFRHGVDQVPILVLEVLYTEAEIEMEGKAGLEPAPDPAFRRLRLTPRGAPEAP